MEMHDPERLPEALRGLRLPAVGAPLFLISAPKLVIAQCKAGIIGSFPALNAREREGEPVRLEAWLKQITEALDAYNQAHPDTPAAPFAVNQIVHRSNQRLERDLEICARWKVPIWITSMGARAEVNEAAHSCGGIALHDVISDLHAHKAIAKGADGLIAVAAGAGGHCGALSPFALIRDIRAWFTGPLLLSGAISTGRALLAARALGADLGYIGSPFIATEEAGVSDAYKAMIVAGDASDIVTTDWFTGHPANYLKASVRAAGLDPDALPEAGEAASVFGSGGDDRPKAWREVWGAGQGIGAVRKVVPVAELVARLAREYRDAGVGLAAEFY